MTSQSLKFGLYSQTTQRKLIVKIAYDRVHALMSINYLIFSIGSFSEKEYRNRYVQKERLDQSACFCIIPNIFALKIRDNENAVIPLFLQGIYRQIICLSMYQTI